MTRALLAVLLTQAADVPLIEGTPDAGAVVIDVVRARLLQQDGGVVAVTDGAWASTDKLQLWGAEHRELVKRNAYLEDHAGDLPYRWIVGGCLLGIALGAAAAAVPACTQGNCFGLLRQGVPAPP